MRIVFRIPFFARTVLLCLFALQSVSIYSQSLVDSILGKLDPQKYAVSISTAAKKFEDKVIRKSIKVLDNMENQEVQIYRKLLSGKDSLLAKAKLSEVRSKYAGLKNKLKSPAIITKAKQYIPNLDSLSTSLKFLDQNGINGKIKETLAKTNSLKDKFQQADEIKKFIIERRDKLKQQLEKLGMLRQLKQINKKVYYYAVQLKEYKELLKHPKKIQKKALELLSRAKVFQEFFKKNSLLASLFRMPTDFNDLSLQGSLNGLQTRAQVNGLIQQQVESIGPVGILELREQLKTAQVQLDALKKNMLKSMPKGTGNSEDIKPQEFKPNKEKTKSFLQRLEYGTNLQTQKSTSFFPTTTDVGISVGYKLNGISIIGIGVSYKMGLGRGWDAIKFTSEGVGLRSYIDWKIKGRFWVSGGYEINYKSTFNDFEQLKAMNSWQRSGLVGISKLVKVKSKFFKKTKAQLLWDFLAKTHPVPTPSFVFRLGYNFK